MKNELKKHIYCIALLAMILLLSACGGGGSNSSPIDGRSTFLDLNGTVEETTLRAEFNAIDYPVLVYLPPGYSVDMGGQYPVLYMLDAEVFFTRAVNFIEEKNKSVIVVGIGNTDRSATGRRAIDYRMPGAQPYYNFLITQVIPYIDANYSTDVSERTLSGHSLGGLFTGLAVLLEDPDNRYFSRYFSQDGSFWDQPLETERLELELFRSGDNLDVEIIIGGAELRDGNGMYARWYHDLLEARQYENVQLMYWSYQADHSQDFSLSMQEYIDFAY